MPLFLCFMIWLRTLPSNHLCRVVCIITNSQPFLPAEHPVQSVFPSRYIALAIPALVHTLIIIVAAAIIGWHLVFRNSTIAVNEKQHDTKRVKAA